VAKGRVREVERVQVDRVEVQHQINRGARCETGSRGAGAEVLVGAATCANSRDPDETDQNDARLVSWRSPPSAD
jgi:hypothetical protein